MNALEVQGLNLVIDPKRRRLHVLRDLSLNLARGEVLGIIGESGSGKTMMGMSLLRLEPDGAALTADRMQLGETDLLRADATALRNLRGRRIGMIFQDPVGAFNPAKRVGWHADQVLRRTPAPPSAGSTRDRAVAMLADVDIADGARVLAAYPHQLSGGMMQRVLIGLVLAARPVVVVADEPTTNLDNIVEQQILALFRRLRGAAGAAFIFITHDMSVAAGLCDRIAVMYAGELVELGQAEQVFTDPKHPYTAALIETSRALQGDGARLPELAGEPPGLVGARTACAFADRCAQRLPDCTQAPVAMREVEGRDVRCILYG